MVPDPVVLENMVAREGLSNVLYMLSEIVARLADEPDADSRLAMASAEIERLASRVP